jgi:hypothetical protein
MFGFVKKHPLLTGGAAVGIWYFFWGPGKAKGAALLGTGGNTNTFQDVLVLQPGQTPIDVSMPAGGEFVLQMPLGASWDQGTPVRQTAQSSIGATVDPIVPVGAESQAWRGVKGSGTIIANWMDATGTEQTTTITVEAK